MTSSLDIRHNRFTASAISPPLFMKPSYSFRPILAECFKSQHQASRVPKSGRSRARAWNFFPNSTTTKPRMSVRMTSGSPGSLLILMSQTWTCLGTFLNIGRSTVEKTRE